MPIVNSILAKNTEIMFPDLVNIYGAEIGEESSIGPFVEIQNNSKIGSKCKISSHSFICSGVTIQDEVFIGHGVTFTNDLYPMSTDSKGRKIKDGGWELIKTLIKSKASIGSNSTILCGITIGNNSIIGAGSTVIKNIDDNSIYAGNPAKFIRKIDI